MPIITSLSSEEKSLIVTKYLAGISMNKLAKMFSITKPRIRGVLKEAKISLRNISSQLRCCPSLRYREDQIFSSGSIIHWSQPRKDQYVLVTCGRCKTQRYIQIPRTKKFTGLCQICFHIDRGMKVQGHLSCHWKGGRTLSDGYIYIHKSLLTSDDLSLVAHTLTQEGYILEHRLVMARHLGRALERHEIVHHLNGIKDDNRITNLLILTASTHGKVEAKLLAKAREEIKRLQVLLEAQGIAY